MIRGGKEKTETQEEQQIDPARQVEIDAMDRDQLEQERARLEEAQADTQAKMYRGGFWSSLMKGLSVVTLVLLILCLSLSAFMQKFIWFGIVAAVLWVVSFILYRLLSKKVKSLKAEKHMLWLECSAVYDRLDGKKP